MSVPPDLTAERGVAVRGDKVRPPAARASAPARSRVGALALAAVFAAVIAVSSWVSVPIPISPVPLTLQTLAVLVAGGLLGRFWGPVSVGVYLLIGVAGVPVFAAGEAGISVLIGFKGGYLVGFVAAAFVMGAAGDLVRSRGLGRRESIGILGVAAFVASVVIYAFGVPWLAAVTGMGFWAAVSAGALPYLLLDAVKAAAAVAVIVGVDEALRAQGLR
jgi:biotin transport system substrate-specific component